MVRKWDQQKRGYLMINLGPKIASEIGLWILFPSKKSVISSCFKPHNPPTLPGILNTCIQKKVINNNNHNHNHNQNSTNLQLSNLFNPPSALPKNNSPPIICTSKWRSPKTRFDPWKLVKPCGSGKVVVVRWKTRFTLRGWCPAPAAAESVYIKLINILT